MEQKIADRIRRIRTIKRLTQENVADELGISHGAYAKIERNETDPNTNRLLEIAKILGVNVTEFFEDSPANSRENKSNYGFATKDEVEDLANLVRALVKEVEKLRQELPKPTGRSKKAKK